jgi:hypothetical protein
MLTMLLTVYCQKLLLRLKKARVIYLSVMLMRIRVNGRIMGKYAE